MMDLDPSKKDTDPQTIQMLHVAKAYEKSAKIYSLRKINFPE